jgi:pimeloyl-ACP methyl ester carboxylesterase
MSGVAMPEQGTVRANGLTFGTLTWSPSGADPAGAPLALLLHGYPDSAWTWRHVAPRLAAAGWRVVAPWSRGYAPTDLAPNDRYRAADLGDDAIALHAALGGDERGVLVGHDWGAIASWAVAARPAQPFARIVAMSVPPPLALLTVWRRPATWRTGARQLGMSWYMAYNQLPVERTLNRVIPRLWRAWSPALDGRDEAQRALLALAGPGRRRAALQYYRDNLRGGGALALFGLRPAVPVLTLHGEQDGCLQPEMADVAEPLLAPGSRSERVPGAGHFLPLERPEDVARRILAWIGRSVA